MIFPSTFSIVAYDPEEPAWGVAVASKFLAVGAIVPWARAGAGAVATQSYANTSYGSRGLIMMESGQPAEEVLKSLLAQDSQADHRQVGVVDVHGRAATFTGAACNKWAGGLAGDGFAVQGNLLTGPEVVQRMAETFKKQTGNLAWRLYHALFAGDQAGGDRRGRQSAAIYVVKQGGGYGGFNDRWIDYRVDDHPDPLRRLGELLELHDLYFGHSPPSDRIELSGEPLRQLQVIMRRLGYYQGPLHGEYDQKTASALENFIGSENFEERADFAQGRLDRPIFEHLLKLFGNQE